MKKGHSTQVTSFVSNLTSYVIENGECIGAVLTEDSRCEYRVNDKMPVLFRMVLHSQDGAEVQREVQYIHETYRINIFKLIYIILQMQLEPVASPTFAT